MCERAGVGGTGHLPLNGRSLGNRGSDRTSGVTSGLGADTPTHVAVTGLEIPEARSPRAGRRSPRPVETFICAARLLRPAKAGPWAWRAEQTCSLLPGAGGSMGLRVRKASRVHVPLPPTPGHLEPRCSLRAVSPVAPCQAHGKQRTFPHRAAGSAKHGTLWLLILGTFQIYSPQITATSKAQRALADTDHGSKPPARWSAPQLLQGWKVGGEGAHTADSHLAPVPAETPTSPLAAHTGVWQGLHPTETPDRRLSDRGSLVQRGLPPSCAPSTDHTALRRDSPVAQPAPTQQPCFLAQPPSSPGVRCTDGDSTRVLVHVLELGRQGPFARGTKHKARDVSFQ